MATETLIKFRQGEIPANSIIDSSIAIAPAGSGEPLWDITNEKLYVTNGTSTPVLIGPISPTSLTVTPVVTSGTHIATINYGETETQIYAPTAGESVSQTLNVTAAVSTETTSTPPTLTISNGNAVELIGTNDNIANQGNVTITVGGRPGSGTSAGENAAIIFEANVSVIDGGSWDAANNG